MFYFIKHFKSDTKGYKYNEMYPASKISGAEGQSPQQAQARTIVII